MRLRPFTLIGTAAIAAALAGCTNTDPGFVAKQWSEEMRELQMNPVFPPREDFYVGDVYLPAVRPADVQATFDKPKPLPLSTWLTRVPVAQGSGADLESFYRSRNTYPKTKASDVPGGGNGQSDGGQPDGGLGKPTAQPVLDCSDVANFSGSDCNIFTNREKSALKRLRVVGFPTFLSTEISQGSLSAFVPAEAFTAALGLEFGDIKSVSVSVPVAESIGLPAIELLPDAQAMLAAGSAGSNGADGSSLLCGASDKTGDGVIGALLPDGQRPDGPSSLPDTFFVHVISEVFYTRAIDVNVITQQSFGFGGKVQPVGGGSMQGQSSGQAQQQAGAAQTAAAQSGGQGDDQETGEQTDPSDASNGGAGENGSGTPPASSQDGSQNASERRANTKLDELNRETSNLPSSPGANIQFLSVSDGQVGMRRTFVRPIAIGYRGITLEVRTEDCRIVGGGATNTPGPLKTGGDAETQQDSGAQENDGAQED